MLLDFSPRTVLLAIVALLLSALLSAEGPYTIAVGRIGATDQEAQECYFGFGSGQDATMVILHPKNENCVRLRELVGKSVLLKVVVEDER